MLVVHDCCTFEQSDVMLIRKGKQKNIVGECCTIMGRRNNKLKDQKGQAGRNSPKEILPLVKKDYFKSIWLDKNLCI